MRQERSGRTLQTARSVLQVLRMMGAAPNGVRSQDVAQALNKSTSTANYLLNSLCSEGFAERDAVYGNYRLVDTEQQADPYGLPAEDLNLAVDELYARTNERSYLATTEDPHIVIHESLGRQGLPKVPGLAAHIGAEAHAVSIGKTILANSGPDGLDIYQDAFGLQSYTPNTLTTALALRQELAVVREQGYALDREEFAEGVCCIAAPVFDRAGKLCGALALSTTRSRFEHKGRKLIPIVVAIARAASHRGMAPSWEQLSTPRPH